MNESKKPKKLLKCEDCFERKADVKMRDYEDAEIPLCEELRPFYETSFTEKLEQARREGFEAGAHRRSNAGTHGKIPGVICISERTIEDGWQKYSRLKSLKG